MTESTTKEQTCVHARSSGSVWSRTPTLCGKRAKVLRDGKPYCGVHDPVTVEARRAARMKVSSLEYDAKRAEWAIAPVERVLAAAVLQYEGELPAGIAALRRELLARHEAVSAAREALARIYSRKANVADSHPTNS